MAAPITNWIFENKTVTEKDLNALAVVKKKESRNTKKGYRWVRVTGNCKLHVPCDKDGNPTEEGRRRIKLLLEREKPYL